ncbi:hypothetical protein SISSUDRAFT_248894 [Sistotremastrum suecicum HHB10207 ss-3]|uniref:MYND-type domain-containing protein n=1 Tax=Sistotremastrum suecicum HHB10207 ss-3 TaxID=1314776 RepID=A0A165ZXH3_9AGAM|nr:hypothetical protein SISSUDRAFT_248894 [Sistotremastrum suecicum HHB10207 ss-3]
MQLPSPLEVLETQNRGRIVVSTRELHSGDPILTTYPYAVGVLDSHRKRLCSSLPCSLYARKGYFSIHCVRCDQSFYCSQACMWRDAGKHELVCETLKRLRSFSAKERDRASLVRLALMVLLEYRWESMGHRKSRREFPSKHGTIPQNNQVERAGFNDGSSTCTSEPASDEDVEGLFTPWSNVMVNSSGFSTFGDVMDLQSHTESWTSEQWKDWEKHESFLVSLFRSV